MIVNQIETENFHVNTFESENLTGPDKMRVQIRLKTRYKNQGARERDQIFDLTTEEAAELKNLLEWYFKS